MTTSITGSVGRAPKLSVCIPTFNFGRFIGQTLESILCQATPDVEVVILDGGSTDETPVVVQKLQQKFASLRYVRLEQKGGIDRDMARVVELARGDYCWLFSADDVMMEGALARVLLETAQQQDVYLCSHSNCSLSMQTIKVRHPVIALDVDSSFNLGEVDQQLRYFELAVTTEAFFSFMGTLIVRRATWESVRLNEAFVGSCWAHVARMFELMPSGLKVKVLAAVLVQRRGENDSFSAGGVVRRYALAIQGFQRLGQHFWGNASRQAFHIRRVLRYEFGLAMFLEAKRLCVQRPDVEDRQLLNQLLASIYSDSSMLNFVKRVAFHLFPVVLVLPARSAYQRLRRLAT